MPWTNTALHLTHFPPSSSHSLHFLPSRSMNLDAEALASLFAAAVAAQASAPSTPPPIPHSTFRTSSARHHPPPPRVSTTTPLHFPLHPTQARPEKEKVQCPKCEFSVGTKEGLALHTSQMHKETWVCAECGVESETKVQWQEHLRTYHGGSASLDTVSELMGAGTPNNQQLAELMSAAAAFLQSAQMAAAAMAGSGGGKASRSPSPSPNNKETDPSPSNFTRNYLCHYGECGFGTRDSREFLHHLKDRHEEQFQIHYCSLCNYASKFPAKVTRHKVLVHEKDGEGKPAQVPTPQKNFKCTICPYETEEEARFKKHMRCHNTKAETSCRFCDFETVYSWNLDRHMQGHHIKGRYSCLRCTYSQNTRQSMTFHLQHHHKIKRKEAETQTEGPTPPEILVQVGKEPYIFEKHAVLFHADKAPNTASPRNPDSLTHKSSSTANNRGSQDEDKRNGSQGTSVSHIKVKKYLSESDAIETPSDERDLKEFESDPDVQSRVCSICGYQGKWISEMIRHKRVHTNERPFRCKYCSRTSKWKADLIRHVAKVHGIRVVSKYSRSKTFDSDPTVMRAMKEAHGYMESDGEMSATAESHSDGGYADSQGDDTEGSNINLGNGLYTSFRIEKYASIGKSNSGECVLKCRICGFQAGGVTDLRSHVFQHEECLKDLKYMKHPTQESSWSNSGSEVIWRCQKCGLEGSRRAEIIDHLALNHQLPPFSCSLCSFSSMFRKTVLYHLETVHDEKTEERERITENITYRIEKPVPLSLKEEGKTGYRDGTALKRGAKDWNCSEEEVKKRLKLDAETEEKSSPSDEVSSLSHPGSPSALSPSESLAELPCSLCPFVGTTVAAVAAHRKGHEKPKGLINYKCAFCDWYGKKSQMVFQHMRLHTSEPASYMAEVEKNLITPLNNNSIKTTEPVSSETSNTATSHNALEGFESASQKLHRCKECCFTTRSQEELEKHAGSHSQPTPKSTTVSQEDLKTYLAGSGGLLSDFSAILNAAGDGGESGEDEALRYPRCLDSPSVNWSQDSMDTDSEPEIEDQESYLHAGEDAFNAGLDFVKIAPSEIKKVSIVMEGEPRRMWQCRYCPHVSKRRANVRMHEKKHFKRNPVGLLKCPKCNYRGDKRSLNAHYRVHVSDSVSMPERFPCKICPANFRSIKDREDHLRFHNNQLPIKCTECNYSVPSQEILDMHLKVHASEKESQQSPESISRKSESVTKKSPSSLLSHRESLRLLKNASSLLSHGPRNGAKPKKHSCPSCPAMFADTTQLSRHVRFHGINHEHKCPHCDYSVPFKINLFKHIRSHHGLDADGCKLDKGEDTRATQVQPPTENSLPILRE